jgi:hypothetical protein
VEYIKLINITNWQHTGGDPRFDCATQNQQQPQIHTETMLRDITLSAQNAQGLSTQPQMFSPLCLSPIFRAAETNPRLTPKCQGAKLSPVFYDFSKYSASG